MQTLPRVKKYVPQPGRFVCKTLHISAPAGAAVNLLKVIADRYALPLCPDAGREANVIFAENKTLADGLYTLDIMPDTITVAYNGADAARNGAASICALFKSESGSLVLDCAHIEDHADFSYRGYMLDLARKYVGIEEIKRQISLIATAKYNKLHLHLLDTEHYAIDSKAVPRISKDPLFTNYSIAQMKEIASYAQSLGLDVIPELDLPGHGLMLLEKLPELACDNREGYQSIWAACVCNETLYEVIDRLVEELTEIFPYEYIHMGGDELSFYDIEPAKFWPSWHTCERCKKLGFGQDNAQYFYHFATRVHEILKKHRRKMILFNDAIDIAKPVPLPRDIVLQFWRIAGPGRGPREGCTMEAFLQAGFTVINSFFEDCYADSELKEARLAEWHPALRPQSQPQYRGQIWGGELCAWGRKPHFEYSIDNSLLMAADRLWNETPLHPDGQTSAAIIRQSVTKEPLPCDPFSVLGGRIFPMDGMPYHAELSAKEARPVIECIRALTAAENSRFSDTVQLRRIKGCLIALMDTLIY